MKHLASAICLSGLLAGCSAPRIEVSVHEIAGRYVIELSQHWGLIFRHSEVPCIRDFIISRGSGLQRDWDHPLWALRAKNNVQCTALSSLTLGDVPKNFYQRVPIPDNLDGRYYLLAEGIGWGSLPVSIAKLPPVRYSVVASEDSGNS